MIYNNWLFTTNILHIQDPPMNCRGPPFNSRGPLAALHVETIFYFRETILRDSNYDISLLYEVENVKLIGNIYWLHKRTDLLVIFIWIITVCLYVQSGLLIRNFHRRSNLQEIKTSRCASPTNEGRDVFFFFYFALLRKLWDQIRVLWPKEFSEDSLFERSSSEDLPE